MGMTGSVALGTDGGALGTPKPRGLKDRTGRQGPQGAFQRAVSGPHPPTPGEDGPPASAGQPLGASPPLPHQGCSPGPTKRSGAQPHGHRARRTPRRTPIRLEV